MALLAVAGRPEAPGAVETLEARLLREDPAALAREARERGDPVRGAAVFFRPQLGCARCHGGEEARSPLGPDLALIGREATAAHLIESLLSPSRTIRKGFETVAVAARGKSSVTGLLVEERPDAVVLRDLARDLAPVVIARPEIESRSAVPVSIMPEGLVSQLAGREEFLDLLCYLLEIAAAGPARARELRPAPYFVSPPLPEYEREIDHAGLIAGLDAGSLKRGEAIYERLCANCHGTRDRPGSLPASPRFASAGFKNGSDPYSLYRTLTYGYGLMAAQGWMVPRQKYDVIHYLREAYLKTGNPSHYARVDGRYLERLPKGTSLGPEPRAVEPWAAMDYGPSLMATIEAGRDGSGIAAKGIAVRLDGGPGGIARGRFWILYDHDVLRAACGWSGEGFIDWNGINFNGRHEVHPRIAGRLRWEGPAGPGWADPAGGFDDPRPRGRDGRPYGPLPRSWARFRGIYHFGSRVVLSYTVGETEVLELPGLEGTAAEPVFTRTFNLGPRSRPLALQVARDRGAVDARISPRVEGLEWLSSPAGPLRLGIPAGGALRFSLRIAAVDGAPVDGKAAPAAPAAAGALEADLDLARFTKGGPRRWPEPLRTEAVPGGDAGPFAADVLTLPERNPWFSLLRLSGLDLFPDGDRAAVCTWDGDVWLVRGIAEPEKGLTWERIASGLFQPLGLKIAGGAIHVACRDQIAILRDLNGDGECDFYECFNSDHQVTEHFHEFAMGLQTDAEGNLYYAKGARHARTALVPQHGTLLRVSRDGARTDVVATGFRAPNGVCVNPDGTFFVTDQEGHWTPKNRINLVRPGGFYGNLWGFHGVSDPSDRAMEEPVAWITNSFDRSPAELIRVPEGVWGQLSGSLLNLSYGEGKVFVVPYERLASGTAQGGMCELPLPAFPTGIMRGRFHPRTGDLYACGMFAWAGNRQAPGGLYRIRRTARPLRVPVGLKARRGGLEVRFSAALDPRSAGDAGNYGVKVWSIRRSFRYGSDHLDERRLEVARARLSPGEAAVFLEVPDLAPTRCMEIRYSLRGPGGEAVSGVIHGTIHELGE